MRLSYQQNENEINSNKRDNHSNKSWLIKLWYFARRHKFNAVCHIKINFSWFAYFCWCNHILAVLEQVQCHLFLMAIKIIAVLTNQTVAVHIQTKSWIVSSMVTYKTSLEHKAVDCYMQEKKENFAE